MNILKLQSYSTPNSNNFVNGVLDELVREIAKKKVYQKRKRLVVITNFFKFEI